jgi:hypothetical protein
MTFPNDFWHFLHKSYHRFIAVRIEFVVVTCFQGNKLFCSIFGWVFGDLRLHGVLEVCEESHSVFQLDFEGLVVNG